MRTEDKGLQCRDCGSTRNVDFIQQKKGNPLQPAGGNLPTVIVWGPPWPACLKCRKKVMGSYRLAYGAVEEPVQKEQEVVINNLASLAPQREVIVRIVNQRAIEPTFGWFMFLVAVLAMIIVPFIWFIVSGHWLVVK